MGKGGPLHHQYHEPLILPAATGEAQHTDRGGNAFKNKTKKTHKLTPIQKLHDVFLPPERGVVALIIEAHQDVQQCLHAQALAAGAGRPVQDQLLQLLQTHLP